MSDYIHPLQSLGINGYRPLNGKMDNMKINKDANMDRVSPEWDSLKIDYIKRFIELSKDSKLIFVFSPLWYGMDENQYSIIKTICKENRIPFYDYANNPKYVHNNEYFKDGSHMNNIGTEEFTKDLMEDMRRDKVI